VQYLINCKSYSYIWHNYISLHFDHINFFLLISIYTKNIIHFFLFYLAMNYFISRILLFFCKFLTIFNQFVYSFYQYEYLSFLSIKIYFYLYYMAIFIYKRYFIAFLSNPNVPVVIPTYFLIFLH